MGMALACVRSARGSLLLGEPPLSSCQNTKELKRSLTALPADTVTFLAKPKVTSIVLMPVNELTLLMLGPQVFTYKHDVYSFQLKLRKKIKMN